MVEANKLEVEGGRIVRRVALILRWIKIAVWTVSVIFMGLIVVYILDPWPKAWRW